MHRGVVTLGFVKYMVSAKEPEIPPLSGVLEQCGAAYKPVGCCCRLVLAGGSIESKTWGRKAVDRFE